MKFLRVVAIVAVVGVGLVIAEPDAQPLKATGTQAQACEVPTQRTTMYAVELPRTASGDVRLGWGTSPATATIPGPTIEMIEGECIAITVVNDISVETLTELRDHPFLGSRDPSMPLGVSLHTHGVKYTTASDGTATNNSIVAPGESRTYYWYAAPRVVRAGKVISQGTAGYWWYHDHIVGTDHGTGGVYSGLFGALIVRRPGDFKPDREPFVVVMGPNQTINLNRYPATEPYRAIEGERVEFVVIGFGDEFHTFHLHAHNWADNRTGLLTTPLDETPLIDNKTIGPADSFGFQVIAGEVSGPGSWMLHCHVQLHSDVGMVTFFEVESDGLLLTATAPRTTTTHQHFGRSTQQ